MVIMEQSESSTSPTVPMGIPIIEFSWYDHALFTVMLMGSVLIGIYFGCIKKQVTETDYLMGGKKMKVLPVALSMIASGISGSSLLSVPAEIYQFGATYWISCISAIVAAVFSYKIYLPVFHKIQVTSSYEYLKMRFNGSARLISSILFITNIFLYMPMLIYVPALAFTQATNINIHFITPLVCGICIFYTTIGGLKAVVWSDALQFTAMLGAMGATFYLGVINVGGLANVWNISKAGGRLDINMDINPFKRDTFWSAMIGFSFMWVSFIGVNQGSVQKYLSLPSMEDCKKTIIITMVGLVVNKSYMVLTGLIMYTKYYECDPITTKQVRKPDQMIPFFVLDIGDDIPGLPGLFVAGILCASLSTLSALLNCISGVIYHDFIRRFTPEDISQKSISNILKIIVLVSGIISTALVYVVENLGNLFPLGMKFTGLSQGPLVGLFTLGMMFPKANSKGALTGGLTALFVLTWMLIGTYYYEGKGVLRDIPKTLSVDKCPFPVNVTLTDCTNPVREDEMPFFIYRISYYYYTFVGTMITIIVGLIVSYFTRKEDDPVVHKDLITPVMHFLLPTEQVKYLNEKPYYDVEEALKMVKTNSENIKEIS